MKTYRIISVLLLVASCSWAGTIMYSNTTTDTGFTDSFILNNLVEAGDQIQLSPAWSSLAQLAETQLFNAAGVSGTADVTLRLYSVDAAHNLGPALVTSTLSAVNFAAGSSTPLAFDNLNTLVPSDLVWTLSYATNSGIALELPAFDPPTVGVSDNTTVWWDTGSGLTLTTPGFSTENYYFQLSGTGVPEPGTLGIMLGGIALLCASRFLSLRSRAHRGVDPQARDQVR